MAERTWQQAIVLPTAAGKTGCMDIAVYALAAQADRPLAERAAPRGRIWLFVEGRIVVEEAFERFLEHRGARTGLVPISHRWTTRGRGGS